jgi:hypothetical protein
MLFAESKLSYTISQRVVMHCEIYQEGSPRNLRAYPAGARQYFAMRSLPLNLHLVDRIFESAAAFLNIILA